MGAGLELEVTDLWAGLLHLWQTRAGRPVLLRASPGLDVRLRGPAASAAADVRDFAALRARIIALASGTVSFAPTTLGRAELAWEGGLSGGVDPRTWWAGSLPAELLDQSQSHRRGLVPSPELSGLSHALPATSAAAKR